MFYLTETSEPLTLRCNLTRRYKLWTSKTAGQSQSAAAHKPKLILLALFYSPLRAW